MIFEFVNYIHTNQQILLIWHIFKLTFSIMIHNSNEENWSTWNTELVLILCWCHLTCWVFTTFFAFHCTGFYRYKNIRQHHPLHLSSRQHSLGLAIYYKRGLNSTASKGIEFRGIVVGRLYFIVHFITYSSHLFVKQRYLFICSSEAKRSLDSLKQVEKSLEDLGIESYVELAGHSWSLGYSSHHTAWQNRFEITKEKIKYESAPMKLQL